MRAIINQYTQEAGLRNLEREIASVCRKVAKQVATGEKKVRKIHTDNLDKFLGRPKVFQDELLKRDQVGVATGLAWTPVGGDILFIEATAMRGRGGSDADRAARRRHEGIGAGGAQLCAVACEGIRYPPTTSSPSTTFTSTCPEGAIPKDGPSAGVTMATAMLSLLTGKAVHRKIAMTGEITLRGEVLPVGGIKEKVLAARRAKIDTVILPALNKRDLEDVNETIRKEMKFIFVDDVKSVFKAAAPDGQTKRESFVDRAVCARALRPLCESSGDRRRRPHPQDPREIPQQRKALTVGIGDDAAVFDFPPAIPQSSAPTSLRRTPTSFAISIHQTRLATKPSR